MNLWYKIVALGFFPSEKSCTVKGTTFAFFSDSVIETAQNLSKTSKQTTLTS